jgi:hypothetical protein
LDNSNLLTVFKFYKQFHEQLTRWWASPSRCIHPSLDNGWFLVSARAAGISPEIRRPTITQLSHRFSRLPDNFPAVISAKFVYEKASI